jgi:hypothetical protein
MDGPGCHYRSCQRRASRQLPVRPLRWKGIEAEIVKGTDYREIAARVVMYTPWLTIDREVKSSGRVPSWGDIAEWRVAVA